MTFGEKLRAIRQMRFLTQQRLADDMDMSQASITSYENGTRIPPIEVIKRFAAYFNVPLTALLPSDNLIDDDYISTVAESLHKNPKLRLLFDRSMYLSESDLDAVLTVVNAIAKERGDD